MSTMTRSFLLASGGLTLLLAACNTFDPNLGSAPFRCGTEAPRCPTDYTCVTYSAADEVCEREGDNPLVRADSGPQTPDARAFTCSNDSETEPNESLNDPTLIIPRTDKASRLVLAICPSTDQDFFSFDIETKGTDVVVEIAYQANRGTLLLDLLNSTGSSISAGIPVAGNANIVRAAVPNLPIGTYLAHIRSEGDGVENNYTLEIAINP